MEYKRLLDDLPGPDYVIVDIAPGIRQFLIAARGLKDTGQLLTNQIEDLVPYVMERRSAECGIEAYIEKLLDDTVFFDDERLEMLFTSAVRKLGRVLIQQLEHHGLYSKSGLLFYRFYGWADPVSPILQKYVEFDAFAE